jgi:hypothetical protein
MLKRKFNQQNSSSELQASTSSATQNPSVSSLRQNLCLKKLKALVDLKDSYLNNLYEHCYLKSAGNYIDYNAWKLSPSKDCLEFINEKFPDQDAICTLEVC